MKNPLSALNRLSQQHSTALREPQDVISQEYLTTSVDPRLLQFKTQGDWESLLNRLGIRLLVSREYEHFVLSLGAKKSGLEISYAPMPHPSGIAVDRLKKHVYIASTRNPNQIYTLKTCSGLLKRRDMKINDLSFKALVPIQTSFYPGSLYVHDLAFLNNKLYATAVGHNAIVEILGNGRYRYVWWPKCVEQNKKPRAQANYLQLNSIASRANISSSFFTASTDKISSLRPGHIHFPVDKEGVLFSGKTREPVCFGLTRPHSAKWHRGKVWLNNSGYGELGFVDRRRFESVLKFPGWTRGLCIHQDIAFVGVSRVIPRFYKYAPGLDAKKGVCGIFAVDLKSSRILAKMIWPYGNQIFAVDWINDAWASGLTHTLRPKKSSVDMKTVFYSFKI